MPVIEFVKPTRTSPYAPLVKEELDGLLAAIADGKADVATRFTVPTVDANKVKTLFADEANKVGKTARWVLTENDGKTRKNKETGEDEPTPDAKTTFTVILVNKHKARRGQTAASADESGDAPAE